ncbi:MAG TPA: glycoside hydrolase family 97 protein [Bacteroidales bacterium]|nr:glycoside hydrolase family 97 protein [Bacteroidales bacterium]HSA44518.1 glycoside hydrolase family 97 protein [Bacteroidales bacterium]
MLSLTAACCLLSSCKPPESSIITASPDGSISVEVSAEHGIPAYAVHYIGKALLNRSGLGFSFGNAPPLDDSLEIIHTEKRSVDDSWKPLYGTDAVVRNHYNETDITFREITPLRRSFRLIIRAYNDGIAFRYVLDEEGKYDSLLVTAEHSGFRFASNDTAWWIPHDEFAYESLYRTSPLDYIAAAATPLTVCSAGGVSLCLHEAALLDYPEMFLLKDSSGTAAFTSGLWPGPGGICARVATPFTTPWRCLLIADRPGGLIESHLIENLNDACRLEDTGWIRPLKFNGIWWGMHTGQFTWKEGPRLGATTAWAKEYIDFAAAHRIGGFLAEGWNKGWESWASGMIPMQDFCTPNAFFDLEEVLAYARSKQVAFIAHHETGGNIPEYERQMEAAFDLCRRLGIHYLKTGYAGSILPEGQHHHGQTMVRHFQRVVETAARYQINLDVHESIKPTGLCRSWPNLMTQEAVRGNEWNAGYRATPPSHATILPFTRMVAGPLDYTPGIFHIIHSPEAGKRLYCTLTHQLAMFVVFYSPMMMVSDLPENYTGKAALRFVEEVPCTWQASRVIDGAPGKHVCIARKSGHRWFTGALTGSYDCLLHIPLGFLDPDRDYLAEIYCDAAETDWESNPEAHECLRVPVRRGDTVFAAISKAGGHAMILQPSGSRPGGMISLAAYNHLALKKMERFRQGKVYGRVAGSHLAMGKAVQYLTDYSKKYPAGGAMALTDGITGSLNYAEHWQGFEGSDLEAVVDLGQACALKKVEAAFLGSPNDWIFLPLRVSFLLSADGRHYREISSLKLPAAGVEERMKTARKVVEARVPPGRYRYVKIRAEGVKTCPAWHPGSGKIAWLFCDEFIVE